jgi:hypothetical protein
MDDPVKQVVSLAFIAETAVCWWATRSPRSRQVLDSIVEELCTAYRIPPSEWPGVKEGAWGMVPQREKTKLEME